MKEPKAPRKPNKPSKPKELLEPDDVYIDIPEGTSLAHILERIGDVDPAKVRFDHVWGGDYYDCEYHFHYKTDKQPNPKYEQQLERYKADMVKYEDKMAQYEVDLAAYKPRYKQWLEWKYEQDMKRLETEME